MCYITVQHPNGGMTKTGRRQSIITKKSCKNRKPNAYIFIYKKRRHLRCIKGEGMTSYVNEKKFRTPFKYQMIKVIEN